MILFSFLFPLMAAPESPYTLRLEAKIIPIVRVNPDFNFDTDDSTWITQQNIRW